MTGERSRRRRLRCGEPPPAPVPVRRQRTSRPPSPVQRCSPRAGPATWLRARPLPSRTPEESTRGATCPKSATLSLATMARAGERGVSPEERRLGNAIQSSRRNAIPSVLPLLKSKRQRAPEVGADEGLELPQLVVFGEPHRATRVGNDDQLAIVVDRPRPGLIGQNPQHLGSPPTARFRHLGDSPVRDA